MMKPIINLAPLRRVLGWAALVLGVIVMWTSIFFAFGMTQKIIGLQEFVLCVVVYVVIGWLHRQINSVILLEDLPLHYWPRFDVHRRSENTPDKILKAGVRVFIGPPEILYHIRGRGWDNLFLSDPKEYGVQDGMIEPKGIQLIDPQHAIVIEDELILSDKTNTNTEAHMDKGTEVEILDRVTFASVGYHTVFVEDVVARPRIGSKKRSKEQKKSLTHQGLMKLVPAN